MFVVAAMAGAINSVAGGGTLITFPTLVWLGVPALTANITNSVALWPGQISSVWGYRRQLAQVERRALALVVPSIIGGVLGGVMLILTPSRVFDRVVPFLILFATMLFTAQSSIQRRFDLTSIHHTRSHWLSWTILFQFIVALYGGYFGAGMGILMLAALSLMGHTDIHRMNALKNLLAVCMNGAAAIYFALTADVAWFEALVMATGAIVGGTGGAGLALRLGPRVVRAVVIVVGFGSALALLVRAW
jgi:uncharacterized membrane protein YfcA